MTAPPFWPATLVDYAQVISAIATAGAVIVSLWIALRVPKPKLTGSATIRVLIWPGQPNAARPEYLVISVTNIGPVDAKLTNFGWCLKTELRRKGWKWGIQDLTPNDRLTANPKLPHLMKHGDEAMFYLPLQGDRNWKEQIGNYGLFEGHTPSRESLEYLFVVIYTSVGTELFVKPGKEVLDMIWSANHSFLVKEEARKAAALTNSKHE